MSMIYEEKLANVVFKLKKRKKNYKKGLQIIQTVFETFDIQPVYA